MAAETDLVLLSGGLDSVTALAVSHQQGTLRHALSVDYGQRHRCELVAAGEIAALYGVPHDVVDLSDVARLLRSATTLVGHGEPGPLVGAVTVVPNRNALLISVAAAVALAQGCTRVVLAVHAGDHEVYPDCRPEFVQAAAEMLTAATRGAVQLVAPFVTCPRTAVVQLAAELGVPIARTWSCYRGGEVHCGTCGACTERRAALLAAQVSDPTTYGG